VRPVVLDSWAVLAWLRAEEPAATAVDALFDASGRRALALHMSIINLAEVWYVTARRHGQGRADTVRDALMIAPFGVEAATDARVWRAGALKSQHRLALADAFAAALAIELEAELATGDPELKALGEVSPLRLRWLTRGA